jgi:hypothetical protein
MVSLALTGMGRPSQVSSLSASWAWSVSMDVVTPLRRAITTNQANEPG